MWRKIFDVFFWVGLAAYFGGLMALGPIAAPAIFKTASDSSMTMEGVSPPLAMDKQVGGEIFGAILNRFTWLEVVAVSLMLIGLGGWMFAHRHIRYSTWVLVVLWLALAGLLAYDAAYLRPKVWEMRKAVRETAAAHVESQANWPEQDDFNTLHVRSETVGRAKGYALLAMILLCSWRGLAEKKKPLGDGTSRLRAHLSPVSHK